VADVVGVMEALGHDRMTLVVHDWGGLIGWYGIGWLRVPHKLLLSGIMALRHANLHARVCLAHALLLLLLLMMCVLMSSGCCM
jgi:hypothetical protein